MNAIRKDLALAIVTAVGLGGVGCAAPDEGAGEDDFGQVSQALVPFFHNAGTVSGWDGTSVENRGSVSESTSAFYRGPTSIKATQVFDAAYHGRYHAEKVKRNAYQRGDTGFYGFAFRLQQDWQFQNQGYVIQQFIADFTAVGGHCDDWMPTSMVWVYGHELHTRVKSGTNCNQVANPANSLNTGAGGWVLPTTLGGSSPIQVSAGVWHTVEIQASWKSDTTGYYKIWYDGVKLLEKFNIPTTTADQQPFEFHAGIYANGWHDDGRMVGTQGTRSIWYDQIGIGSTFADANPNGTW